MSTPPFPLGQIVATRNALDTIHPADMQTCLARHAAGDWGELDPEDKRANDQALIDGTRLLSAYRDRNGNRLWIITEADRSSTTVLRPEDY